MDINEKESKELSSPESIVADDHENDQNEQNQKTESFRDDSANGQTSDSGKEDLDKVSDHQTVKQDSNNVDLVEETEGQVENIAARDDEVVHVTDGGDPDVREQIAPDHGSDEKMQPLSADSSGTPNDEGSVSAAIETAAPAGSPAPDISAEENENLQGSMEEDSPDNKNENSAAEDQDEPGGENDSVDIDTEPSAEASSSEEQAGPENENEPDSDEAVAGDPGGENDSVDIDTEPSAEASSSEEQAGPENENEPDSDEAAADDPGGETDSVDNDMEPSLENASPDSDIDEIDQSETSAEDQPAIESSSGAADSSASDGQESSTQQEPESDSEEQQPESPSTGSSLSKIAVAAVLICAVVSGFFIFDNKSKIKKAEQEKLRTSETRVQPSNFKRKKIMVIPAAVNHGMYDIEIDAISSLRDILLEKQAEVVALKQRYQHSIEELEREILDEQQLSNVETFLQATENKRIVYSLKTIQRRQAYIRQLKQPYEWVSAACEELLYLKRRMLTDIEVSAVASSINMDRHVQQIQQAVEKFKPTAEKLAMDPTEAQLESLEKIWEHVQNKQDWISLEPIYSKNQTISQQICAGDFSRMGELSEMSVATAKCITEMKGSDLFLNQITEISPGAARHLCQWKGSWICMNNIKVLSPRVAHYLFQWEGSWISLNGLTEFPAEIGETLLKWGGGQLELMGLQKTAGSQERIGIEYLAEWERSGGKLFIPQHLREKIDALNRQSG